MVILSGWVGYRFVANANGFAGNAIIDASGVNVCIGVGDLKANEKRVSVEPSHLVLYIVRRLASDYRPVDDTKERSFSTDRRRRHD